MAVPRNPVEVRRDTNDGMDRALGYRQFQVANYVLAYLEKHNTGPRYEQICEETGIGTHGEVSRIVKALEAMGMMSRSGRGSARRITKVANQTNDPPGVEVRP